MSYFADDPWGSSPGSSAPAYSFGEQPAAPQPAFAAPHSTFAAPQTDFAAPQTAFAAPQPAFSAPQTAQAFSPPVFATQAGAPVFNNQANHAAPNQTNMQMQEIPAEQKEKDEFISFLKQGCCFCFSSILMVVTVFLANTAIGVPDGPTGQYNMATSFVDQGSIDGLTVGICDGNFKYNVTTSGTIQSDNYPSSYNPQTSCTNQFNSTADGITFEFQSFFIEQHFDFIVFRDSAGNDYGGGSCSGQLDGTRISVDSSRLPISIHFNSDDIHQKSGFSIVVSAGYDSSNEIANGPCGNQDFLVYDDYYK